MEAREKRSGGKRKKISTEASMGHIRSKTSTSAFSCRSAYSYSALTREERGRGKSKKISAVC
jgi:hypothetical protein